MLHFLQKSCQLLKTTYLLKTFLGRDVPLGKLKLADTFTQFGPKIRPVHIYRRLKICPDFEIFSSSKFRFEKGHPFIRGVKMRPYFAAHPQYLLSPEYHPPLPGPQATTSIPLARRIIQHSPSNLVHTYHSKRYLT